jgi:hypothetical protein
MLLGSNALCFRAAALLHHIPVKIAMSWSGFCVTQMVTFGEFVTQDNQDLTALGKLVEVLV